MGKITINGFTTPVTEGSNGIAAATVPNVCKMPGPPAPFVPTPLPNIGRSGDSPEGYSVYVTFEGHRVAIGNASFGSIGDIASKATGGGIVSGVAQGRTVFLSPGATNVFVEGKPVHVLGDAMLNNCAPGGGPANAATMAGVLQAPGTPGTSLWRELNRIARECNREVNRDAGYRPPRKPNGRICTKLGIRKHSCCEKAIKEGRNPCVRSEVAYRKDGSPSATTRGDALVAGTRAKTRVRNAGGAKTAQKAAFRKAFFRRLPFAQIDVVVLKDPDRPPAKGNILRVFDFKFNCRSGPIMSEKQMIKYTKLTGKRPRPIHAR
jgi:hypothetical protein